MIREFVYSDEIFYWARTGNKDIVAYTPVDLRPIFHFETGGNGSSTFPIPYSEELDTHDLGKRAKTLRTMLDVQVRPENLYQRVRSTWNRPVPFIYTPLPAEIKSRVVVRVGRIMDNATHTYGISYADKVRIANKIDPHVTSLTTCAGSYSYPLWILACEHGNTLRMVASQAYESDMLAKNICTELAASIPGTTFIDWGHHEFDTLHIRDFQHL